AFVSLIPVPDWAYTYSYASLGEFLAWITGWNLVLEYGVACVTVSIGWSGYLVSILERMGIHLPTELVNPPGVDGGIVNLPAVLIVLALTGLLVLGVK